MKKVLLFLSDGLRSDAIEASGSVIARDILAGSCSNLESRTVYPSVTLPCHMSLFYSVPPERHGITTNTYHPQVRPIDGLCDQIRNSGMKSALFFSWGELRDLVSPDSIAHSEYRSGGFHSYEAATLKLLESAKTYITEEKPEFVFFYVGTTDTVGHDSGWMSENYLASVRESFRIAKELMDTVGDEYITIITSDHGGHGRSHGSTDDSDMVIPIIISGLDTKPDMTDANIIDIAPTITKLLGIPACSAWEGRSFI